MDMSIFNVDPDIRRARTLSSKFYLDEEYFDESKRRIFRKSWHFAGTAGEVDNLRPIIPLSGIVDEPLLLTRTGNNVACMSNVCTHRGKVLVEEPCTASLIRCGYHGRRFSLDGRFLSMPEFEGVVDFPSPADDLAAVPSAKWGDMVFVSVDPKVPFADIASDIVGRVDITAFSTAKLAGAKSYNVAAHWALYCENYLEGFHIPFVHRSLNEIVDYPSYSTETFRYCSLQTAKSGDQIAAKYLFVFPNLMLNFYPWGISVNVVRPIGPARTAVEFLTYVTDESEFGQGAGGDLESVELEDESVVESVQRGIRSSFYSQGRYSPSRENGTHHFHRLICEFMNDAAATA